MKLTVVWDGTTWVVYEDGAKEGAPCCLWLTQDAPAEWVERLVRENFEVAEDDVIVVVE